MRKFGYLLLVLFLATGCSLQVKTRKSPSVDFNKYTNWCWMKGCDVVYQGPEYYRNEEAMKEMANAIAATMHGKGYVQGDENSDLLVNFYVIVEQDSAEINTSGEYVVQPERRWLTELYPEYQHFLKGTLVIDIMDRKASKLIWTSKAVKYLELNPTLEKAAIWKSIKKAMKKLPQKEN